MKRIAMIFATREGHTQRIAEHIAAGLRSRGFEVDVFNARDREATADPAIYGAAVLAASVHAGKHEAEMIRFVKNHRAVLESMPAAFLSVTLSEAGAERPDTTPEEHARFVTDVQKVLDVFFEETGWHPKLVKPVAGALLYTKYNFFIRLIMKRISQKSGGSTDTSRDHDYTDWKDLDRFVSDFADLVGADVADPTSRSSGLPA